MPFLYYIFGLGNTIADLGRTYGLTYSAVFREFGMPYDPGKVPEYSETPLERLFRQFHTGCTCEYRDFVTMTMAAYERNLKEEAKPFPDVTPVLRTLYADNRRLGVISRSYEMHVRSMLSDFGIEGLFCSVVGLERALLQRPNPYSVDLCMKEMGADREHTLLVSSDPLDIETGHNAGMRTALLDRTGAVGPDCGPTFYLTGLEDVLKLV